MVADNQINPDNDPADSQSDRDLTKVNGDPGVGGLLADPLEAASKSGNENVPASGQPSPDPEPPKAHGDWAPNRTSRDSKKT